MALLDEIKTCLGCKTKYSSRRSKVCPVCDDRFKNKQGRPKLTNLSSCCMSGWRWMAVKNGLAAPYKVRVCIKCDKLCTVKAYKKETVDNHWNKSKIVLK